MGSCVFQCDVPHRRITHSQFGPVLEYCDWMGCHVLCLWHDIPVWQHLGQSTTATSDIKPQTNKQTNQILNLNDCSSLMPAELFFVLASLANEYFCSVETPNDIQVTNTEIVILTVDY